MSDELGFLVAFTKASRSLLFVRIINRLLSRLFFTFRFHMGER